MLKWLIPALMVSAAIFVYADMVSATGSSGDLELTIVDATSMAGIADVQVTIRETRQSGSTDSSGRVLFVDLSPGDYTVAYSRMGYVTDSAVVSVVADRLIEAVVSLNRSPIELPSIPVSGTSADADGIDRRTALRLEGAALTSSLRSTVAETMSGRAGVSEQSMGPNAVRPVLRGMGGHRVQVLEDGRPTGDLSANAPDHAVLVESMSASRIELIRGPAVLLYSNQVMGGVVDVKRELIASKHEVPASSLTGQFASMNRAMSGHFSSGLLFGPYVIRVDIGGRSTGNLITPSGMLAGTNSKAFTGGAGLTRFFDQGSIGLSYKGTRTQYGIPGGFAGSHAHGVTIDMEGESFQVRSVRTSATSRLAAIESSFEFTRYYHRELESNSICGVSFGTLAYALDHRMRFTTRSGDATVVLGVGGQYRDLEQGCLSFLPEVRELAGSGFIYGQKRVAKSHLSISVRADGTRLKPSTIGEVSKSGILMERRFLSLSVGAGWRLSMTDRWGLELSVMSTSSAPSYEQLYSDGPHLAAFSYEVGNSQLGEERANGIDVTLESNDARITGRVSLFATWFDGYLFPRNTGEMEYGPGESGVLPRYQYSGRDALMTGGEMELAIHPGSRLTVGVGLNYVRGVFQEDQTAIPFMPPFSGRCFLEIEQGAFTISSQIEFARRQERFGEFETPTNGWVTGLVVGEYTILSANVSHAVVCRVENIGNVLYRNHLSRIKSVYPEPGRSISLLYRLTW